MKSASDSKSQIEIQYGSCLILISLCAEVCVIGAIPSLRYLGDSCHAGTGLCRR